MGKKKKAKAKAAKKAEKAKAKKRAARTQPANQGHILSHGDTGRFRSGYNECPGCGGPKGYYAKRCLGCLGRKPHEPRDLANRLLCGGKLNSKAARETGKTCKQPAGWKTPHPGIGRCYYHGGMQPTHLEKGLRVTAEMQMRSEGNGANGKRKKQKRTRKAAAR